MIQINNISKSFGTKVVLDNIQWEIPKATIFGLVGPNGAGKSTLLRLISGVLKADQGQILFNQKEVYNQASVKKHILFVSDDPFFLAQSSLKEMKAFYQIFYPSFNEAMYVDLVEKFKMDENVSIADFSKGMKRQAAIILALSVSPDVLLLDEAFDGLDPIMRLALKRILAQEMVNRDMSVVISSHNLRELEDICDRIALLNNHHISLQDDVENIRTQYHKLQIAYKDDQSESILRSLNPLHIEKRGHVFMLVIKGDVSLFKSQIETTQPILFEEIPVSMEEVFVYEMEDQGYGKKI